MNYYHDKTFRFKFYLLVLAIFWLVGCLDDSKSPAKKEPSLNEQLRSQLSSQQLAKLDSLVQDPTAEEISRVRALWAARSVAAIDAMVVDSLQLQSVSMQAPLYIISHQSDEALHYAGLIIPPATGPLPLLVFSHGGDEGVDMGLVGMALFALGDVAQNFAILAPSFRAEPLSNNEAVWLSTGQPSPWDRDVDDLLRSIAAVDSLVGNLVSTEKIAVLGISRGATVGLLASLRDSRIGAVVNYFGPTDFFGEFSQMELLHALTGSPTGKPGVDFLWNEFFAGYFAGNLSLAQIRSETLRRSPRWFAQELPAVQIHHGSADSTVSVQEALSLWDAMAGSNSVINGNSTLYIYPEGGHNPLQLQGSLERVQNFLRTEFPRN